MASIGDLIKQGAGELFGAASNKVRQSAGNVANSFSSQQPTIAQTDSFNNNQSVPNIFAQQSSPFIPAQPITANNINPTSTADSSTAPVVPANTSDANAQFTAISDQVAEIQKQADALATQPQAAPTATAPQEEQEQSIWDRLFNRQEQVQEQVQQSQQSLQAQQEAIFDRFGVTPESLQKIQGLTSQIGEYQKQLAAIETREAQAIDAIQGRAGVDIANAGAEQSRIQRAYAIQKAGVAAQASALSSTANALRGDYDSAFASAQTFVENATKAQQQVVSDLRWGFSNYADIITGMNQDEQNKIKLILEQQESELDRQQTDFWRQSDLNLKKEGIQLDWAKYNLDVAKATGLGGGAPITGVPGFTPRANLTAKDKEKIGVISTGVKLVSQLEKLYNDAVGEEFSGFGSGVVSRIKGVKRAVGSVLGTNQKWTIYQNFIDSNRAGIAKGIKGEVGNLAKNEQENALKSFPNKFASPQEAKAAFDNIKTQMDDQLSSFGTVEGGTTGSGGDNDPLGIR